MLTKEQVDLIATIQERKDDIEIFRRQIRNLEYEIADRERAIEYFKCQYEAL